MIDVLRDSTNHRDAVLADKSTAFVPAAISSARSNRESERVAEFRDRDT